MGRIGNTSPKNAGLSHRPVFPKVGGLLLQRGLIQGVGAEVYRLTKACHEAVVVDRAHHMEAVWHDESHPNKHLLYSKPTRLLFPEHMWDAQLLIFFWEEHQLLSLFHPMDGFKFSVMQKGYHL